MSLLHDAIFRMIGTSISHYRVTAQLGAGGMGEVYRATDSKLGRDVALKVLPVAVANDPERLARFQREAQVLASLNHPHIAVLHGLEDHSGVRALVMELVEGPTLAERIATGKIPLEEALPIARQIAEALEYAHEHGVIHRDLKPGNVKLTNDGAVKVLDFGLAKALQGDPSQSKDPSSSPTLTMGTTRAGLILGTAAYMSPEQAKGKAVDRRADIWAFGVVLYEMLSGRQAFPGETASDSMAAVITLEPDWNALPANTPARVRELLRRCLTKDPKSRLRDIGEARILLEQVMAHPEADATASGISAGAVQSGDTMYRVPASPLRRYLPWAVAVLAIIVAAFLYLRPPALPARGVARFVVNMPPGVRPIGGLAPNLAISADGQSLAFVAAREGKQQIYVRRTDSLDASPVAGTEDASYPFLSPDGQWVAFFSGGKLKKVQLPGGSAVILADAPDHRGGAWLADDTIVYSPAPDTPLFRLPASGGNPQPLTKILAEKNERTHRWPFVLPGGRAVLFTVGLRDSTENYDDAVIDAVVVATGERKQVLAGARTAKYLAPTGHLVYAREDALYAVPFDAGRLTAIGKPVMVAQGVMGEKITGASFFSVSETGTLLSSPGAQSLAERVLAWTDFSGKVTPLPMPARQYWEPKLSPDGRLVSMDVTTGNTTQIWAYDLERKSLNRLSFGASEFSPIWSGDGRRVIYTRELGGGKSCVAWRLANGTGDEEVLHTNDGIVTATSASADGKWVLMAVSSAQNRRDIYALNLTGDRKAVPFVDTPSDENLAEFSPDGRWVVYSSSETGRYEVYVKPFPSGGGRWQVSADGGGEARWSPNGKEIIFKLTSRFFSAPVETGATFRSGTPRFLFDTGRTPFNATSGSSFDLSHDGKRILFAIPLKQEAAQVDLVMVTNWAEEVLRATAQKPPR